MTARAVQKEPPKISWNNVLQGLILASLVGFGTMIINIRDAQIRAEEREKERQERIKEMDGNMREMKNDVRQLREKDMQDIKDRVKEIEVKDK